jgi:hypothetical protein
MAYPRKKVGWHNSKWLYYSIVRHSGFCSAESPLQNPVDGISIAVEKSRLKIDTSLMTIFFTKKRGSFASLPPTLNLFDLKISGNIYLSRRKRAVNCKALFKMVKSQLRVSE